MRVRDSASSRVNSRRPVAVGDEPLGPAVAGVAGAGDEAGAFEPGDGAADLRRVGLERLGQRGGGGRTAVAQLVEQPRFGERIGRAEVVHAERADAGGVEAVEAADGGGEFRNGRCGHESLASLGR